MNHRSGLFVLMTFFSSLAGFQMPAQSIPIGSIQGSSGPLGGWTVNNAQSGTNCSVSSCAGPFTSLAVPAFTNPLTNGSLILVSTQNFTTVSTTVTVTDTAGNSYTSLGKTQWLNGTADYFCATNTHATASNVITFSASTTQKTTVSAIEITNTAGAVTCASNIDGQGNNGTSSTGSTTIPGGNFTTSVNQDFIWAAFFTSGSGNLTVGSGFTKILGDAGGFSTENDIVEYLIQPTAGNITTTATNTTTGIAYNAYSVGVKP